MPEEEKKENPAFEPKNSEADKDKTEVFASVCPALLPLVDEFRTLNWIAIKRELEVSKIFEVFPMMALQN